MLKAMAIGLVVVLTTLALFVAVQPAEFRVTRSIAIAAPPATVFAQVNDLHAFNDWNPYAKKDPAMKATYEGQPAGAGAIYRWAGNSDVGEGSMTILESRPNELVRMKLAFVTPFEATNTVDFTIQEKEGQSLFSWSMFGTNNFMAKAIHLVMNMDKMVGGDFEKGLADLKALAESRAGR